MPRRPVEKVLISVAVAVALLFSGIAVIGAHAWWTGGADIPAAKTTTGHYLGLIEAGDDSGAYQLLCHDTRTTMTTVSFTATIRKSPRPARHRIGTAHVLDEAGNSVAIDVRLTDQAGTARAVSLPLHNSSTAGWQICGTPVI